MYQNMCLKKSVLVFALAGGFLFTAAQDRRQTPPKPATTTSDTAKPKPPVPPKTGPKPYKEIITAKAVTRNGLFTVHKQEDKYFFEFGDSIMGRDILVVNRISKA